MPQAVVAVGTLAGAFSTAVGGLGATLGATTLGTIFTSTVMQQLAAGAALSFLSRVVAGQQTPSAQSAGMNVSIKVTEDTFDFFGLGKYGESGQLWYHNSWDNGGDDAPNEYYVQVIKLSTLPAKLKRVYVNGVYADLIDGTGGENFSHADANVGKAVEGYEKDGEDRLFIKFYDGTQTKADPYLLEKFGAGSDEFDDPLDELFGRGEPGEVTSGAKIWTKEMVGWGCAYAIVTAGVRGDVNRSRPQIVFELEGTKLYDRRKDSSAGGRGPQRWGRPKTWRASNNPIVMADNIIRGIHDPITGELLWGGAKVTNWSMPQSMWVAAMNACDETWNNSRGQQPSFEAGIRISMDQVPSDVIDELMLTCMGRIAEVCGEWHVAAGRLGTPIWNFTDNDVLVTSTNDLKQFSSLSDRYNGIRASYPSSSKGYNNKDAPERISKDFLKDDLGRDNVVTIQYKAVTDNKQVQRLMYAKLKDSRRQVSHVLMFGPEARKLGPLDIVSYTSAENQYTNKRFLVEYIEDLENGCHMAVLREVNPEDIDFNISDELPDVPVYRKNAPRQLRQFNFQLSPSTIKDKKGRDRAPAIRMDWDVKAGITGLRVRVRLKGNQDHIPVDIRASRKDSERTDKVLKVNGRNAKVNGRDIKFYVITFVKNEKAFISGRRIVDNEEYQVSVMPEPVKGWRWSEWKDVETPDVKIHRRDIQDKTLSAREMAIEGGRLNKVPDDQLQADAAWHLEDGPTLGFSLDPTAVNTDADSTGCIIWRRNTAPEGFCYVDSEPFSVRKAEKINGYFQCDKPNSDDQNYRAVGRLLFLDKQGVQVDAADIATVNTEDTSLLTRKALITVPSGKGIKTAKFRFAVFNNGDTTASTVRFYSPRAITKSALSDLAEADDDFIDNLKEFSSWVTADMIEPDFTIDGEIRRVETVDLTSIGAGWTNYLSMSVTVPAGGARATVWANVNLRNPGGGSAANWEMEITHGSGNVSFNGSYASNPNEYQPIVPLQGYLVLSPGTYNVKLRIRGDSPLSVRRASMIVGLRRK